MKKLTANFISFDDASRALDAVAAQVSNPKIYNTAMNIQYPAIGNYTANIDPVMTADYLAAGFMIPGAAMTAGLPVTLTPDYYYDGYTRHINDCTTLEVEASDNEYERISQMLYSGGAVFVDM